MTSGSLLMSTHWFVRRLRTRPNEHLHAPRSTLVSICNSCPLLSIPLPPCPYVRAAGHLPAVLLWVETADFVPPAGLASVGERSGESNGVAISASSAFLLASLLASSPLRAREEDRRRASRALVHLQPNLST